MRAAARHLPPGTVPALLFLVGVLLRAPSLALPLGPSDAGLALAADDLAHGRWPDFRGQGPLLPLLLTVPVAAGAPAAGALRVVGLLLGALAPLLLHRLANRLGFVSRAAALAGLLLALHPVLIAHAGGPEAGAQGLALVLLIMAALRLLASPAGTRRLALTCALLATLAWPGAWLYLVVLAIVAVRAESSWKPRTILGVPALGALALAITRGPGESAGPLGLLVLALPALGLVVLLPFAVTGWLRLLRNPARPRALLVGWSAAALAQATLLGVGLLRPGCGWGWEAAGATVLLAPLVVLFAVEGVSVLARGWRLRVEFAALALGLMGSLLAGLGPAQAGLLEDRMGPAGRLHELGAAARLAELEAGPDGWVAIDIGPDRIDEARALALWLRTRPALVTPASGGSTSPPSAWPRGGPPTLALLTLTDPGREPVTTLGGFGIFAQERAGRSGPYHVLRVRRP